MDRLEFPVHGQIYRHYKKDGEILIVGISMALPSEELARLASVISVPHMIACNTDDNGSPVGLRWKLTGGLCHHPEAHKSDIPEHAVVYLHRQVLWFRPISSWRAPVPGSSLPRYRRFYGFDDNGNEIRLMESEPNA